MYGRYSNWNLYKRLPFSRISGYQLYIHQFISVSKMLWLLIILKIQGFSHEMSSLSLTSWIYVTLFHVLISRRALGKVVETLYVVLLSIIIIIFYHNTGRTEKIYDSLLALATYFDQHGDFFLSDHFYTSAHHTSRQIRADGGRKEAEANCNLGKAAERKKDYRQAIELYERFYYLVKDKPWKTVDKDEALLCKVACQHLLTAHVSFSNQVSSFLNLLQVVR